MEAMAIIGIILLVLIVMVALLYVFAPWIFYDLDAGAQRLGGRMSQEAHVVGERFSQAGVVMKEKAQTAGENIKEGFEHMGDKIDRKLHPEIPPNVKKFVDMRIDERDLVSRKEFGKLESRVEKHHGEFKSFRDEFKTVKVHIDDIDLRVSRLEGNAKPSQAIKVAAEKAVEKAKKVTA
ncbi:MAG: hypothetical protein CVT48_03545 [Thermoplasmata archaeon HGW-Thermoplasmata-1]|nr:MAG: hypothetical protein CVT48_03545 [Thermoplasmata archaeon HGW-Thermoplasmata-1]